MHRDAEAMGIELGDALRSLDAARDHVASHEHARNEILTHTATTVREPLGLLLSTLEPLTQSTMLGFEARGPVEQAIRLGKEASYGASAIADATLLRTGTLTLEPMAVDVCGLVDDALDAIRRRQEVVAPRFHVHAESDVPYVFADPERLAQVLATLFGRAAALSPDGAAMIRIEGVQETVQITLEDRRASSEPDRSLVNAPALPSSQGAASPIADLRLWIAGRIMRLHGYPIVCQPRDDDEGFRWIVKLPRSKVESIAPSVTTPVDSIRTLPPAAERVAPRVNLTIPSSNGVTFVPGTRRAPLAGALAPQALPKLEFSSDGDSPLSTRPRISLIPPASITRGIFDSDARVTLMPASLKPRSVHAPTAAQSTAEVAGYRPRVLVADDDPVVRNVVAAQLGELDVDVTMAVDGVDALARIQSETPFDLVLSDVLMPRLTGLQLCKIIRETHSTAELPFVLMSSNALKEDVVRAFEAGASDFMTKPTVKEELLQRIATHLQISKETNALTRFVPREFLRLLGRDRVADVRLGDHVAKDLTILFADIRGFTAMSEAFGPAGTFRFLNQCLSRIAPHIHANGGFIDKYIGDALMALFPTNAIGAVRAAVAIQAEVAAYNREHDLANDDSDGLAIGVGIFRGPTMLGTIGEPSRFEATVISDAVNVAARLEALTRRLGVRVLIGETVLTDLAEASFALRPLGRVVARGRGEPVAVWELLDAETDDVRGEKTETMETFLAAVDAFERGAFAEAIAAFDRVLEQSPNDGPSWIYQQACQRFLTNEIPFGFRGALDFGGDK
jgi:class 3 adenylate cyclase